MRSYPQGCKNFLPGYSGYREKLLVGNQRLWYINKMSAPYIITERELNRIKVRDFVARHPKYREKYKALLGVSRNTAKSKPRRKDGKARVETSAGGDPDQTRYKFSFTTAPREQKYPIRRGR
jgi:hypothetical protein